MKNLAIVALLVILPILTYGHPYQGSARSLLRLQSANALQDMLINPSSFVKRNQVWPDDEAEYQGDDDDPRRDTSASMPIRFYNVQDPKRKNSGEKNAMKNAGGNRKFQTQGW